MCVACHRFGDEGGGIGPDLPISQSVATTNQSQSTIHPSMVALNNEQYQLTMKDGSIVMGQVVAEENGEYSLVQSDWIR